MAKELIGGRDGSLSELQVSCIDQPPTLEHHQKRQDQSRDEAEVRRKQLVKETNERNNNQAVVTLLSYAAELEPYGTRTKPPSWLRRIYIRWTCKLQQIIEIIKE